MRQPPDDKASVSAASTSAPAARRGLVSPELVLFGTNRNVEAAGIPRFELPVPAGYRLEIGHAPGMTAVVLAVWPADFQLETFAAFCDSAFRRLPLDMMVLVLPAELQPSDDEAVDHWERYRVIVAHQELGPRLEHAQAILTEHLEQSRERVGYFNEEGISWTSLEHPS